MAQMIEALGATQAEASGALRLAAPGQPLKLDDGDASGSGFSAALSKAAEAIVQPQQDAAQTVQAFANGADGELHKSMLTLERADITLKFAVNMRNKLLEAYREIMHMGS